MKLRYVTFVWLVVLVQAAFPAETKFAIDPVHSGLNFRIRHLYTMLPGRFDSLSGTITCDTNDLKSTKVHGSVDVASISTANADRDKHLRTADFFNVEKFPVATFESTEVVPGADHALTIRGVMTLHGVTADVVFEGRVLGYGVGMKGEKRVGYQGKCTIDREKFGVSYNAPLASGIMAMGKEVELTLDIEAIEMDSFPEKTLGAELQQLKTTGEKNITPEIAAALEEAKARIAAEQHVNGLKIGENAPDFVLPDTADKPVSLGECLKKGPALWISTTRNAWSRPTSSRL